MLFFFWGAASFTWLRTNGVNTNGAAAKVITGFWPIEEKATPWHFWEYKSRLTGVPKKPLSNKYEICSHPISADPICLFPNARRSPPDQVWQQRAQVLEDGDRCLDLVDALEERELADEAPRVQVRAHGV